MNKYDLDFYAHAHTHTIAHTLRERETRQNAKMAHLHEAIKLGQVRVYTTHETPQE